MIQLSSTNIYLRLTKIEEINNIINNIANIHCCNERLVVIITINRLPNIKVGQRLFSVHRPNFLIFKFSVWKCTLFYFTTEVANGYSAHLKLSGHYKPFCMFIIITLRIVLLVIFKYVLQINSRFLCMYVHMSVCFFSKNETQWLISSTVFNVSRHILQRAC